MPLRSAFVTQLYGTLEKLGYNFLAADFAMSIDETASDSEVYRIVVEYKYEPKYFIAITFDISGRESSYVTTSPGHYTEESSYAIANFGEIHDQIRGWASRLNDELVAIPIRRLIEEQQTRIAQLESELDELPDEYFTREEAVHLMDRLTQIEAVMQDLIVQRASNEAERDSQIMTLHAEITALKDSLNALKKPGWIRAAITRLKPRLDPETQRKLAENTGSFAGGFVKGLIGGGSDQDG